MARKYDYCQFSEVHKDCFALQVDGRCFCLDDTDFKKEETCPFYKVSREVDPRVVRAVKRMNETIRKRRKVI